MNMYEPLDITDSERVHSTIAWSHFITITQYYTVLIEEVYNIHDTVICKARAHYAITIKALFYVYFDI